MPGRQTAWVGAGRTLALAIVGFAGGCARPEDPPNTTGEPAPAKAAALPPGQPLSPGDEFPPLSVAGWLNSTPRMPPSSGARLVVVDVWAHWCPFCRMSLPGLIHLHRKYAGQGVEFVSLTSMPRSSVEPMVREHQLPWANGFGATRETIAALGVSSGMPTSGYEIAPTLYLVGGDGRVRWNDSQGRYRHTESREWARQADEALAAALDRVPDKMP